MITRNQAKALAETYLSSFTDEAETEGEVVVVDSATIERAFGWVFFYQSRSYLETGELTHQLAGNSPLIVNRYSGEITSTGTAHPTEYYLAEYEASHPVSGT